jgi:pimeloyl-ACP methyl ester carboxylesterase
MAPVARNLAPDFGVLEPLQTMPSLKGQVNELAAILGNEPDGPVTLVVFSWGVWLSYLVAAATPELVKKLILVGSGPYQARYTARLHEARLIRLSEEEGAEYNAIIALLNDPDAEGKAGKFARLGQFAAKTDQYGAIPDVFLEGDRPDIQKPGQNRKKSFHGVLDEAQAMRRNGELLVRADEVQCPVVAIHGDYDPHPAAGVFEPLLARLIDFRFIPISQCGHKPWIERQARDKFYKILRAELRES